MRLAIALAATLGLAAVAAEAGDATIPAGAYEPFLRLKAQEGGPAETVRLAAFRLEVEPVTNAEFLAFVTERPQWRRSHVKRLYADANYLSRWRGDLELADAATGAEPVTNLSWFAAQAYCRARGGRLPSTAQWEYALADAGRDAARVREASLAWLATPNPERLPPVGAQPANGYGVKDMVGLIWEWTLDFDAYATSAESRDPNGKDSGFVCGAGAAGATDSRDYPAFMRFSLRASLKADYTADNVGFRCAGEAP
jgi:formylglycine-generating enzyme required for sulfatase activity